MDMTTALELLHRVFGHRQFRPHQQDIVAQLLAGGDALVLMPTGGGKSLCYQLPSLLRDGIGIVVSPLIALMRDQGTMFKTGAFCCGICRISSANRVQAGQRPYYRTNSIL